MALPKEVFFSNVPYSTTEETLQEVFSRAGTVLQLQLFRQKTGESRGMGVVTFADPESVQYAVQNLRDYQIADRAMWVSTHSKSEGPRGAPAVQMTSSKVFFSNVPFHVDKDQLTTLFSEVGVVKELTIFQKDGQSRGMGHCTFQVPSMAAAAIQVLRDRDVGGRPIWIAEDNKAQGVAPLAVPQMAQLTQLAPMTQLLQMSQMSQLAPFLPLLQQQVVQAVQPELNVPTAASGSRIFFSNVPFDVQELQLQQVFQSIGPIVELNLMRTPDGKSRGMGHCTYATPDLAAAAIQYLLDRDVGGRPLLVKQDRAPPLPSAGAPAAASYGAAPAFRGAVPDAATSSRIFFSNVPYEVSEEELLSLFQQAGTVLELNLFKNDLGRSRGMGHCLFDRPESALHAIQLRDVNVGGRPIWVAEDSRGRAPPNGAGGKGRKGSPY